VIAAATREGLAAARRNPGLAVVLWLVNLALAAAAGVPGWLALASAIGPLPEADALRERFVFGVVFDLLEMRPGLLGGLALSAVGVAFLGLLAGAAVSGGVLEVLASRDARPFAHRFGRGAGRFFARFVRAGLAALLVGAVGSALVAGPLLALGTRLRREHGLEAASLAVSVTALLAGGLVVLVALLALDVARVRIVREDARRVLPLLASGFTLVLRHPVKWLGAWALNALLLGLAFAAYLAVREALPAGRLLLLLVAAQQAFVLARSFLRVALFGAGRALVERLLPQPAVVPEPDLSV
jgi:hypothetical protein